MRIRIFLGMSLSLISPTACDPGYLGYEEESEDAFDDVELRALESNGLELNGWRLNGFRLNGFRLNGLGLSGELGGSISLLRLKLPNSTIALASWLEGGDLHAMTPTLSVLSGSQLVGSNLDFRTDDGLGHIEDITIRIGAVAPLAVGSAVLRYDFVIKTEAGPWQPLCADALGNQVGSVLLADVWSPLTGDRLDPIPTGAATAACLDGALGKCVEWGYVPWQTVGETSLRDYHQTCTRAVRADYCGDGTSYTSDGTQIHVLDQLGIEESEPNSTYVVEAEWGPDGAVCLNLGNTRLPNPSIACSLPACGASFASGGTIQTGKVVI
jgi:hypothetical protein